MTGTDLRAEVLVQKLRRAMPLAAHGRPPLTKALRRSISFGKAITRLMVTDVFDAGEEKGLMCRVDVLGAIDEPVVVVAPVTQLAFNRRHPVARDIAAYRERRAEAAAVTDPGGT